LAGWCHSAIAPRVIVRAVGDEESAVLEEGAGTDGLSASPTYYEALEGAEDFHGLLGHQVGLFFSISGLLGFARADLSSCV
jgi:hypothetical protein